MAINRDTPHDFGAFGKFLELKAAFGDLGWLLYQQAQERSERLPLANSLCSRVLVHSQARNDTRSGCFYGSNPAS